MFYNIIVSILKVLVFIVFDLKTYNKENINNSYDSLIVCGNHTSMLDPLILAVVSKRQIHFMGKKELFENKILGYLFRKLGAFPVDRQGASMSAIRSSMEVLKNKQILGIFPEGTRVKTYDENNAKSGIALIANKAKSNIMPFYIKGPYKFRGRIEIHFGEEKNYLENYEGRLTNDDYTEIGRQVLKDIYKLGDKKV